MSIGASTAASTAGDGADRSSSDRPSNTIPADWADQLTACAAAAQDSDGAQHCITCSDEGVPMRIEELLGDGLVACVDGENRRSEVLTGLVGDVTVGNLLLVHAGTALLQLSNSEQGGAA